MLKTFVMTWEWMELPIDLGVEKQKIEDRIHEKDKWSTNSFGSMYEGLCITADQDNQEPVLVSDYTEENQENSNWVADFVAIYPCWELMLPRNREITALNRPMVMWAEWDVIKVVAR